jgi:uncharacterized membrane protein
MAAHLRERRLRLVLPLLSVIILAWAVYESRFPTVEYWDPKPLPVTADAAGDIAIPLQGNELRDGRLHKFSYRGCGTTVRFLVLMKPDSRLTVTLDACSICKPDGYGQLEGNIICYYCKTLIPVATVGKTGGCNPVPVAFREAADAVHIDGPSLTRTWEQTVQAVQKVPEGGR